MTDKPLTEKQIGVAIALFRGSSVREAAKEFEVCEATIYDWRKKQEFMDLWRNLEVELKSREIERLRSLREKALSRIEIILENPDSSDRSALQAASIALRCSGGLEEKEKARRRNLRPVSILDSSIDRLSL